MKFHTAFFPNQIANSEPEHTPGERTFPPATAAKRRELARLLGHSSDTIAAVPALLSLLHDESPEVIEEALCSLGKLQAPVSIFLLPYLDFSHTGIATTAAWALERIYARGNTAQPAEQNAASRTWEAYPAPAAELAASGKEALKSAA